jgi:hypothetical protein
LQFEHGLATTLRAIAYAAQKEPPVAVIPQPTKLSAAVGGQATVYASGPARLQWTVRDADFETMANGASSAERGDNPIQLPPLPAGRYWLDVIARDATGTSLGWGSGPLDVTSEARLTLASDKEVYQVGQSVTLTGELQNVPDRRAGGQRRTER